MDGWVDSDVATHHLVKIGESASIVHMQTKPDLKLSAKSDSVLFDGNAGSPDKNDKAYLVFSTNDCDAVFQVNNPLKLSQVSVSFFQDEDQGIFSPQEIEVWGGLERNKMESLGKISPVPIENGAAKSLGIINFSQRDIRFLRLRAKNIGMLPSSHPLFKKGKSMIYLDEVALN